MLSECQDASNKRHLSESFARSLASSKWLYKVFKYIRSINSNPPPQSPNPAIQTTPAPIP